MAYKQGQRRGRIWADVQLIDRLINEIDFVDTGQKESDFARIVSTALKITQGFHGEIISEQSQGVTVPTIRIFGPAHRPDLSVHDDGIAIELKLIGTETGIKTAIGQAHFYRVRYRFVVNLIILKREKRELYLGAARGEEEFFHAICRDLSLTKNIFTYIVPAFKVPDDVPRVLAWNDVLD